ncbi:MAG: response regulator transcription factor [Kangiellaceae bacterium]|nr:response regulator transcription factor [Kangiellaceae bacterium]
MEILIVEDDQDIAELLKVNLNDINLNCDICPRGDTAVDRIVNKNYALVILDIALPGKSGLEVCKEVRELKPEQPILMLTAKSSELDQIIGLEVGADDYMTKPFSIPSLQARVRTRIKRSQAYLGKSYVGQEGLPNNSVADQSTQIGRLSVDPRQRSVLIAQQKINLTALEFDLLNFFAMHPEQVFSRTQLLDKVWGYNHDGYEHTVNSHINRLRNKMQIVKGGDQIIQTVWGVGYRFSKEKCQLN